MPEYFKDMDVTKMPMSKHLLAQKHEWSGRMVSATFRISTVPADQIEPVHCFICPPPRQHAEGGIGSSSQRTH